jgi:hypothetical protein
VHANTLTDFELADAVAQFDDIPGDLVADRSRQERYESVLQDMEQTRGKSGRSHADDDLSGSGVGTIDLLQYQTGLAGVGTRCEHGEVLLFEYIFRPLGCGALWHLEIEPPERFGGNVVDEYTEAFDLYLEYISS